jgi:5'-3' exonuclease
MKIIGVDISLIFSMCWEASEGKEFSAAFRRTVDIVTNARAGFDRCMLAIDSGASFRKACPEYKSNRSDRGEPYREQLKRTIERLVADGCVPIVAPVIGTFAGTGAASYAEADDVMGWAVEEYSKLVAHLSEEAMVDWSFAILSDDSDMEQLIDDAACVFVVKSQLRGGAHWTEATVKEKRGVAPAQVIDIKALAGDQADGYKCYTGPKKPIDPARPNDDPGFNPGVGPGHAAFLIEAYGGALAVFDTGATPEERAARWEADGVKPNIRATLERHGRGVAEKGIFLATIRRELPGLSFDTVMAEPVVKPVPAAVQYTSGQKDEAAPESAPAAPPEVIGEPVERQRVVEVPHQSIALTTRIVGTPIDIYGLQPRNIPELEMYADIVMNSRSYSFSNKEQVMMCIIEARERGVPIGAALRAAYNVNGKLAWSASYLAALVLSSGKFDYFEITSTTSKRAELAYRRSGRPGGLFDFTIEEAQDAGWMKSGARGDNKWITNPRTMLRWAAMREGARAFAQDIVNNMYTPDELGGTIRPAEFEAESAA